MGFLIDNTDTSCYEHECINKFSLFYPTGDTRIQPKHCKDDIDRDVNLV